VIVEYKTNEMGKKVKVTRKIRMHLVKERVHRAVAERKQWAKFGLEAGKPPGPDVSTTTVGEKVFLRLSAGGSRASEEEAEEKQKRKELAGKKILCRICKGDHFTTKCPYKDTLKPIDELERSVKPVTGSPALGESEVKSYVPPHLRNAEGRGEGYSERERREENTLRVTNLSEDTTDEDLRALFCGFGPTTRVFLPKDRETNMCRGFAFVSFVNRDDAQRALEALNGYGYDNLILHVEWSKPNPDK
jgi:translation initiation factor 3 subunit G